MPVRAGVAGQGIRLRRRSEGSRPDGGGKAGVSPDAQRAGDGGTAPVDTHDQKTLPLQIRTMREYAAKRGWEIAVQIKEVGSGAVERELREKLLQAARRREIDVVLVWRLDRWGRSLADLVVTL